MGSNEYRSWLLRPRLHLSHLEQLDFGGGWIRKYVVCQTVTLRGHCWPMVRCHDTEILTPSFSRSALDEEVGLSERLEGRADGVFHVSWLRINLGWVVSSFYDVDSEIAIARERERIPSYHIAPLYMLHVCYICVAYGNIMPYWAKWYASGERWNMEPFQSPMGWCGVEVGPFRQHGTRQWAASEIPPHRCGALVSLWDRMMIIW